MFNFIIVFSFCGMLTDPTTFIVFCFLIRTTSAIGGAASETSALSIVMAKFPDNLGAVTVCTYTWLFSFLLLVQLPFLYVKSTVYHNITFNLWNPVPKTKAPPPTTPQKGPPSLSSKLLVKFFAPLQDLHMVTFTQIKAFNCIFYTLLNVHWISHTANAHMQFL